MKLSKCIHGILVITKDKEVGMIVGIAYNLELINCSGLSKEELLDRTVPLVQFPRGTRSIHPGNIEVFTK